MQIAADQRHEENRQIDRKPGAPQYRTGHYLDKDGATREAIVVMTTAVPNKKEIAAVQVMPERVGVLLVNLGTPDSADAKGVRVYLKEFLSDPRVIENQGLLWKLA